MTRPNVSQIILMEELESYQLKQCNSLIIAFLFQVFVFVEISPFNEDFVGSPELFITVQTQARRWRGSHMQQLAEALIEWQVH